MDKRAKNIKTLVIWSVAIVYAGAIAYSDVMFLSMVSKAFPNSDILRVLAYGGAVMVGLSAILIPLALHFWNAGTQFYWVCMFWLADVVLLALNTMLSYQIATNTVSEFMSVYKTVAPASPLLAVIGWGIAFLLDTSHKARHAHLEAEDDINESLRGHLAEAVNSKEVVEAVRQSALAYAKGFAATMLQRSSMAHGITLASNGHGETPETKN